MQKKMIAVILVCLLLFPISVIFFSTKSNVGQENEAQAKNYYVKSEKENLPCKKSNGEKFTIAYVDIDPYPASGEMLYYFIQQLNDTGWISLQEELPFDPKDTDAKKMISYLSRQDLGEYIQFSDDANYYIAVDDKNECMESLKNHVANKDIDLIFCMGTSPGTMAIQELGITDVPIMVYFSVDPVGAGLSETEEYSGQDNIWCHTSSDVYKNQLQFYYNNYEFSNIGMVYYSESVGAMNQYRQAAEQIGCKISEKQIETLSGTDQKTVDDYYEMLARTFEDLITKDHIDAFMLGTDIIKDEGRVYDLLNIFYKHKIPVFVQNGEYYVEDGAFMVVTASDAVTQAPFAVNAMAHILNGENPGDVYQKFVISPYVSLNLEIADQLDYDVREELLLSAEKLYTSVKREE